MSEQRHIHDCTGPEATCPCGYVFTTPRFVVSIEVHDNKAKRQIINEGFSTDGRATVIATLRDAIAKLEAEGQ
jgi:hypothetical protein